jgi:hypothetical protein
LLPFLFALGRTLLTGVLLVRFAACLGDLSFFTFLAIVLFGRGWECERQGDNQRAKQCECFLHKGKPPSKILTLISSSTLRAKAAIGQSQALSAYFTIRYP